MPSSVLRVVRLDTCERREIDAAKAGGGSKPVSRFTKVTYLSSSTPANRSQPSASSAGVTCYRLFSPMTTYTCSEIYKFLNAIVPCFNTTTPHWQAIINVGKYKGLNRKLFLSRKLFFLFLSLNRLNRMT